MTNHYLTTLADEAATFLTIQIKNGVEPQKAVEMMDDRFEEEFAALEGNNDLGAVIFALLDEDVRKTVLKAMLPLINPKGRA